MAYNCDAAGPEAPTVETVGPVGAAVPAGSWIEVTFSEPMAEPTVVISFEPAVTGTFVWLDSYTLRFRPAHLEPGVSYVASVRGRAVDRVPVRGRRAWRFTTAAGAALVLAPGRSLVRVPILMYHYIRVNPNPWDRLGFALSVTPADFAAQMSWLAANGYHPVTMKDLAGYVAGRNWLPDRPVVITFDDGYADFYTAAMPVLLAHGFTAVSYVVSGFVGRPGYMSASQVIAAEDTGFEIGSHTVGHVDLTKQSDAGLRYQLGASKRALEALLRSPVVSFCYPFGRHGARESAAVEAAGYLDATTTAGGSWHGFGDRFVWTRVRVSGGEGLQAFAVALQSF